MDEQRTAARIQMLTFKLMKRMGQDLEELDAQEAGPEHVAAYKEFLSTYTPILKQLTSGNETWLEAWADLGYEEAAHADVTTKDAYVQEIRKEVEELIGMDLRDLSSE